MVSFILVGIAAGPSSIGLLQGVHEVEVVAEIGVILLLFTIDLEFSFSTLLQIKKNVFVGGLFQVAASILATVFLFLLFTDYSVDSLIFIGFFVSLSSTVIVMKLYQ